jgi:O-antigen/teichoic acid export membrane protein
MTAATIVRPDESVARLGAHTLVMKLLGYGSGLPAVMIVARHLGAEARGVYAVAVAIGVVALTVAAMGTVYSLLRAWSEQWADADVLLTAVAWLSGGLGALAAVLVLAIKAFGSFRAVGWPEVALVAVTMPMQLHAMLLTSLLAFVGQMRRSNVGYAAGALVQTVIVIALYAGGALTIRWVLVAYAAGMTLQWLVMLAKSGAVGRHHGGFPTAVIGRLLRVGSVMYVAQVGQLLLLRLDVFLVARYVGLEGAGVYSIAVLLAELVWLVTDSVAHSLIGRVANDDAESAVGLGLRAVQMSVLLAPAAALALLLLAPVAVPLVFGADFEGSVAPLLVLLPAAIAMAMWRAALAVATRVARPGFASLVTAGALAVNVVANLLLIPALGIKGAALASTIAYGSGATVLVGWLLARARRSPGSLLPGAGDLRQLVALARRP